MKTFRTMDRRLFFQIASAGAYAAEKNLAVAAAMPPAPPAPQDAQPTPRRDMRQGKMKLATQHGFASTPEGLKVCSALGVTHLCSGLPSRRLDDKWSVENLSAMREATEKAGMTLEMVPLPLSSAYITRAEYPSIMLGTPERDKAIDDIHTILRNIGKVGIPSAKYNMSILGVVRTTPSYGRGGAQLSTFNYDAGKQEPALTEAGKVPQDAYWERVTYFLKKVVPVAAENKVKIACHPQDPMMPADKGWRGVHTVLDGEGFKKFVEISASPYHGLNFCQGTVSEGLTDPGKQIFQYIEYFGKKKKIFNVHFRNIKGRFNNFQETFPDDGDVDFIKCIKTYKAVGYDGMLMPDHVPHIEGDKGGLQAFAFAFGYIKALIQMVDA